MSRGLVEVAQAIEERSFAVRVEAATNFIGASIDGSSWYAFGLLSLLYLMAVFTLSHLKLMWLDELITLHVARLGSVSAIWQALSNGADPNPPLTHILVHFFRWMFGENDFALRMPAVIGYWVGMFALFAYLRRWIPPTWALAGTVLSMCMAAFDYSYESRSYAIFYGLAMLAFLCWSRSVDPARTQRQRSVALAGMVLALAAGVSTNYFAVLAFLPIAAGEMTRLIVKRYAANRRDLSVGISAGMPAWRDFDFRVWLGLLLAALPLLAFRQMIAHSIAQFAPYAWNKVSWQQVSDSYTEMVEIVLYPVLGLVAFGLVVRALTWLCPVCRANLRPRWIGRLVTHASLREETLPTREAVGILFLMCFPILGYVIASIRGGMLSPRFVIPVCFGFAVTGTIAVYRLWGHKRFAGVLFLCVCVSWLVARESVVGYWYMEQKQCFYKVLAHLPEAEIEGKPNAPIVVSDPLLALTFQRYAPPAISVREVFPVDFPAIRRLRGDDSAEENLWAGRTSIYTLPIMTLADFQRTAGNYIVIASDGNWLIDDLQSHHYFVKRLDINTRAGAIGGFTPLCHGVPVFFLASGDAASKDLGSIDDAQVPFKRSYNLPTSRTDSPTQSGKER